MALFGGASPEPDLPAVMVPAEAPAPVDAAKAKPSKPAKAASAESVDDEDAPFDPLAGDGAFIDILEEI